jgi:hypothetical protein
MDRLAARWMSTFVRGRFLERLADFAAAAARAPVRDKS